MRRIGSRIVRLLVVAAVCALPVQGFAGNVGSADIVDGAVTTPKIADGAVTASKLGMVCANGEYLQYVFGSGWVCSVGTAGPQGPAGAVGATGPTGPQGPAGSTPQYANVIVVAKSGGEYVDLQSAINSITDASETNKYLIKIMPGTFLNSNVIDMSSMSHIDIEGSGKTTTKLLTKGFLLYGSTTNVTFRNMTIESIDTSSNQDSIFRGSYTGSLNLEKINLIITGRNEYAIYFASPSNSPTSVINISDSLIKSVPKNDAEFHNYAGIIGSNSYITLNNVVMEMNAGTTGSATGIEYGGGGEGRLNINNSSIYASSIGIIVPGSEFIGKISNSTIVGNGQNSTPSAVLALGTAPNINIAIINSQLGQLPVSPISSLTKIINCYDLNYNLIPNN